MICGGTGCTSSGSDRIAAAFERELERHGLDSEVKVVRTGCFGLCALGPIVVIYPEGSFYSRVKEEHVEWIVTEHLLKGRPVRSLLFDGGRRADQKPGSDRILQKTETGGAAQLRRNQPGKH